MSGAAAEIKRSESRPTHPHAPGSARLLGGRERALQAYRLMIASQGDNAVYPAIWTAMYVDKPVCEALRALRAHGWQWFELSTEHLEQIEADPNRQARIKEVGQALEESDSRMPQAHGYISADIAHPDVSRRESDLALLHRHLDCCAETVHS